MLGLHGMLGVFKLNLLLLNVAESGMDRLLCGRL